MQLSTILLALLAPLLVTAAPRFHPAPYNHAYPPVPTKTGPPVPTGTVYARGAVPVQPTARVYYAPRQPAVPGSEADPVARSPSMPWFAV